MNSYFYKFMINLLKRFSSERKLLEARGAFIIRSDSARFLFLTARFLPERRARPELPAAVFSSASLPLLFLRVYS